MPQLAPATPPILTYVDLSDLCMIFVQKSPEHILMLNALTHRKEPHQPGAGNTGENVRKQRPKVRNSQPLILISVILVTIRMITFNFFHS